MARMHDLAGGSSSISTGRLNYLMQVAALEVECKTPSDEVRPSAPPSAAMWGGAHHVWRSLQYIEKRLKEMGKDGDSDIIFEVFENSNQGAQ